MEREEGIYCTPVAARHKILMDTKCHSAALRLRIFSVYIHVKNVLMGSIRIKATRVYRYI